MPVRQITEEEASATFGTVITPHSQSCRRCWNVPKQEGRTDNLAPRHHGIYAGYKVFLVLPGDKKVEMCEKAMCHVCGHIAIYGEKLGIYRFDGDVYDFNFRRWPEFKEYGINPDQFVDYIIDHPRTHYITISEIKAAQADRRTRPNFYEPATEAR